MTKRFRAAVDLGAGSGRVFVGALGEEAVSMHEAHRFNYAPRHHQGHLRWDSAALFAGLREGIIRAAAVAQQHDGVLDSVGIDSWGVDYGLIDAGGRLLEDPVCYRDDRTAGVPARVDARVPGDRLFATTGIQRHPINTLFQLVAHVEEGLPNGAAQLLMIPDLCHYFLCGSRSGEPSNASTTQLVNAGSGDWTMGCFASLDCRAFDAGVEAGGR